jgi:membrane-associated phospholipid phosphatase
MWKLVVKNRYLFIFYLILLSGAMVFISVEGKICSHLLVNRFHTPFFDTFFKISTNLGNGIFMVVIGIGLFFFVSLRYGLIILSSFLSSSLLVQFLKRFFFAGHDRPILFFKKLGLELYRIPGLDYYTNFSFPSGHSTTAFALFIGLALFFRSNFLKFLFLFMACITAFSRVYLSQHFIEDIIAGSVLGTIAALCMHFLYFRWNKNMLDINLLKFIQRKHE